MPQYCEMGQILKNLFRRLESDGLTDHMESQILAMSAHLIEIQRAGAQGNVYQVPNEAPGKLCLSSSQCPAKLISLDAGLLDATSDTHLQSKNLYTSNSVMNYRLVH